MCKYSALMMIVISALHLIIPAMADTIIDPDNVGADDVSNSALILSTGDLNNSPVNVGSGLGPGTLEINANTKTNGVTNLVNVSSVDIAGLSEDTDGEVRVFGSGVPGSATVNSNGAFNLNGNSNALLVIESGGEWFHTPLAAATGTSGLIIGNYASFSEGVGNTIVVVSGLGSILDIRKRISIGLGNVLGTNSLMIEDGGVVRTRPPLDTLEYVANTGDSFALTDSAIFFGRGGVDQELNEVTVTGRSSSLEHSAGIFPSRGNSRLSVLAGGSVRQIEEPGFIDMLVSLRPDIVDSGDFGMVVSTPFDTAEVIVAGSDSSGTASLISLTRDIDIGGGTSFAGFDDKNQPIFLPAKGVVRIDNNGQVETTRIVNVSEVDDIGTGILEVSNGGTITAQRVNIFDGGTLKGDGGSVLAEVLMDGGTIEPGASPGTLDIFGDLDVIGGTVVLEVTGINIGEYDVLTISGDIQVSGGLMINVVFSNEVKLGAITSINLIDVGGNGTDLLDTSLVTIETEGLPDGAEINVDPISGNLIVDLPADSDQDGVLDVSDNCILVSNPSQIDSDGDGYGNICDADFNNDCTVNFLDISAFAEEFLQNNPVFDLNSDGAVNFLDFNNVSNQFLNSPGPGLGNC